MMLFSYFVNPPTLLTPRLRHVAGLLSLLIILGACGGPDAATAETGNYPAISEIRKVNAPQDTLVQDGTNTTPEVLSANDKRSAAKIAGKVPDIPTAPKGEMGAPETSNKSTKSPQATTGPKAKDATASPPPPATTFTTGPVTPTAADAQQYPDHSKWDQQLQAFVNAAGAVDYKKWKLEEKRLDEYLKILAKEVPSKSWQRNEAKAYWLNAYNAFTIKLILKNYPLEKITDLHGGQPWKVKWIELGGNTYSLDQIENDIIRPTYQDPRIHFAVNCAAESCPPLHNRAFIAVGLDAKLNTLTRSFINNERYNEIENESVSVSKIFDWYAADFGDLITYLNRYAQTKISEDATINYREYDWSLNDR